MTVDELVAEAADYRVTHPAASDRSVRAYLLSLRDWTRGRDGGGWGWVWWLPVIEPEGCLVALLLAPLVISIRWLVRRHHARRVERAMAVLSRTAR